MIMLFFGKGRRAAEFRFYAEYPDDKNDYFDKPIATMNGLTGFGDDLTGLRNDLNVSADNLNGFRDGLKLSADDLTTSCDSLKLSANGLTTSADDLNVSGDISTGSRNGLKHLCCCFYCPSGFFIQIAAPLMIRLSVFIHLST